MLGLSQSVYAGSGQCQKIEVQISDSTCMTRQTLSFCDILWRRPILDKSNFFRVYGNLNLIQNMAKEPDFELKVFTLLQAQLKIAHPKP